MTVHIPESLEESLNLLHDNPDAHLLTGGTDLMVEVNFNHRRPEAVIALRKVPELRSWSIDESKRRVRIGAGVPFAHIERGALAQAVPALAEAARTVGSPQIRSAGTLGGNLGTCSPAGDSLPVLAALDAMIHLRSQNGERALAFDEFMIGPKRNARRPDEIITGVTLPIADGWQGYAKVGVRNAMVISVASACLAFQNQQVRIALGSVGPTIIRCREAETWIATQDLGSGPPPGELIREFSNRVAAEARPIDDHRSTAAYRRHAIGVLASRLLTRGFQR